MIADMAVPFANPAAQAFEDRRDAGRRLARALRRHHADADAIVLALPRGGVPVAFEIATALGLPLDVMVVRKLGMPGHEEYAVGAIAPGGVRVLNPEVPAGTLSPSQLAAVESRERRELERREREYRGGRAPASLHGRTVLLVDDGLATGSTMRAAIEAARRQGARRVVAAIPVGPRESVEALRREADEVVCLEAPEFFYAVGTWYRYFPQTTDEEVRALLAGAAAA